MRALGVGISLWEPPPAPPAWAMFDPALALGFTEGLGWSPDTGYAPVSDFLTTTRASDAYADNSAGVWSLFGSGVPRITDKGLLVEEARTNLLEASDDQDNATYWTPFNASASVSPVLAPDGATFATRQVNDNAAVGYTVNGTALTGGTTYTYSTFVKPAGRTSLTLLAQSNLFTDANARFATFTLAGSGTVASVSGSGASATITAYPNGWYRCALTFTPNNSITSGVQQRDGTNGNGVDGFDFWISQLEAGAFATSPIRTTTTAATRAADCGDAMKINNFASWHAAGFGTLFLEAEAPPTTSATALTFLDGTFNERVLLGATGSKAQGFIASGGVTQLNLTPASAMSPGQRFKAAMGYETNNGNVAVDGILGQNDVALTVPPLTEARLGGAATSNSPWNGYIRRVAYFPTRLSNAQLQALTS